MGTPTISLHCQCHPIIHQQRDQNEWNIADALSISSGASWWLSGLCSYTQPFNTVSSNRIFNIITQAPALGVNYDDFGHLITGLDYADDVVIYPNLSDTLGDALANNCKNWGSTSTDPMQFFNHSATPLSTLIF